LVGTQYRAFRSDIENLAKSLDKISQVVDSAKATWTQQSLQLGRSQAPMVQKDWDLTSLREIIGDYHKTLTDCEKLLQENREFKKNRSFVNNLEWNLFLQPKVDQLRLRLGSHSTKIMILLKPLELKLLSEIHHDLAERIDTVHRGVLRLQGLLIPDIGQAISEQQERATSARITIPAVIEKKFEATARESRPEILTPGDFPLQAGADAFVEHFEESTKNFTAGNSLKGRAPNPKQYLSLLKCVWIMNRLEQSDALKNASANSQWPGYIDQLRENLSMQCQRFTAPSAQRLIEPVLSSLLSDKEYNIWPGENIAEYISPHFELWMEEVLKIPMPSPSDSVQREMTVYRLESTRFRIVESVKDKDAPSTRREDFKLEIDLKTVKFTPIYATPSSRPKTLEVLIHSASTRTNPTFQKLKHIHRLQHLLMGYQVFERYDQGIATATFVSSQAAAIKEYARIQLWLPHPIKSSSSLSSPAGSTPQGVSGSSRASLSTVTETTTLGNSCSNITRSKPSHHSFSSSSKDRAPSLMTNSSSKGRTPSVAKNSSMLSGSSVTSMTTISTGTGRAHLHAKPAKPLLVIFLKRRDPSAKLAIAALQIDEKTGVERERCGCGALNSQCQTSCIERSGGNLLLQRWDADQGLGSWNLARLGIEQRRDLPEHGWNNVKRVSLDFDSLEDRYKFSGRPCSCKPKMQHDLANCILERHHGIFGVVKQIGSQRLRNYHQNRDKMAGRNIVIGPLPVDEE
ncbi:hypothetical protein OIDMADRAFT_125583, partial [Oidiodendron maius Zn]